MIQLIQKTLHFYIDGFRSMTVGRTLWLVMAIKLIVIFGILKLFFFPDLLATRFDNDTDRSNFVIKQLTNHSHTTDPIMEGEPHD